MNNEKKGILWKTLSALMVGLILGGAPGYYLLGKDVPTKRQVSEMIRVESPYVKDQKMIIMELTRIREDLTELKLMIRVSN